MDLSVEHRGEQKCWLIFQMKPGQNWSRIYFAGTFWDGLLKKVNPDLRVEAEKGFVRTGRSMEEQEAIKAPKPVPVAYTALTVYAGSIEHVLDIIDLLDAMGLQCDNRIADDIMWAQRISGFTKGTSRFVLLIVIILAITSLYLAFLQKIRRSVPEIGILKAFGSSSAVIFLIQITEAVIIWLFSVVLGTSVAFSVGCRISSFLINNFELPATMRLFSVSLDVYLWTLVGSLLVSTSAAVLATVFVVPMTPATALRHRS